MASNKKNKAAIIVFDGMKSKEDILKSVISKTKSNKKKSK